MFCKKILICISRYVAKGDEKMSKMTIPMVYMLNSSITHRKGSPEECLINMKMGQRIVELKGNSGI